MERIRIVGETITGNRYTIALQRELSDNDAKLLARDSRGRARSVIPADVVAVVTYRESFAVDGMATSKIEIGRIPA